MEMDKEEFNAPHMAERLKKTMDSATARSAEREEQFERLKEWQQGIKMIPTKGLGSNSKS